MKNLLIYIGISILSIVIVVASHSYFKNGDNINILNNGSDYDTGYPYGIIKEIVQITTEDGKVWVLTKGDLYHKSVVFRNAIILNDSLIIPNVYKRKITKVN